MLLRKKGLPEESEIVMCQVTKIHFHSVFVELLEYGLSGMIHISEISPGRIRNIRDFVREGKVIVCKVLNINKERGHIDLSLRRVSDGARRKKIDETKQQQKAEKIVEFVAKKIKMDVNALYAEIAEPILKNYGNLNECFQDVVINDLSLEDLGIKKSIAKELEEVIRLRIKKPEVDVEGDFSIKVYDSEGVNIIKLAVKNALKLGEGINFSYLGGGKYRIKIVSSDYKTAEDTLNKVKEQLIGELEEKGGDVVFERKD